MKNGAKEQFLRLSSCMVEATLPEEESRWSMFLSPSPAGLYFLAARV